MFINIDISREYIHPVIVVVPGDNGDTSAFLINNGKIVKKAEAKLDPADKYSFRVGAELAFQRLFENGEKKEKRTFMEVQRVAKPGEYVKLVESRTLEFENGDIAKITHVEENCGACFGSGYTDYFFDFEYVVLEGFTDADYKAYKKGK